MTGIVGVVLIVISLESKARTLSTWPNTPVSEVIAIWAIAVGIVVFGTFLTNSPVTCGGEVMGAGDRCVNLNTGASSNRQDMEGALMNQPWIYWVIAIAVAAIGVVKLLGRRGPTQAELHSYLIAVAKRRPQLSKQANERFDKQVRAELRRASRLRRPTDGADLKALLEMSSKSQSISD